MKIQGEIDHMEYMARFDSLLSGMPPEKRREIYEMLGKLYQEFADVLSTEQANGVSTGLSQANTIHRKMSGERDVETVPAIDGELPHEFEKVAEAYLKKMGAAPVGPESNNK